MAQNILLNDTQWTQVDLANPTTIISNKSTILISEDPNGANSFSLLGQTTLVDGTYYMKTLMGSFEITATEAIITGSSAAAVPPVINNNNTVDMTGIQLPIQNNVNVPPAQPAINVQPANPTINVQPSNPAINVQAAPAAVTIEVTRVMQDIIDAMAMSAALFVTFQGAPSTNNIPNGKYGLRIV